MAWKTPDEMHAEIVNFVDYYNSKSYHETLGYVSLNDVCFGKGKSILGEKKTLKLKTLENRKRKNKLQKPKVYLKKYLVQNNQ